VIGNVDYYSSLTVTNCYTTGSVTGTDYAVGGLVGSLFDATFNISNCYSICEVSGSSIVGGLVGSGGNYGIIDKSYAGGNVWANCSFTNES
jgi:hypothetical protein